MKATRVDAHNWNRLLGSRGYQQLGAAKEELKGAFEWPVFMRSLAMTDPAPKEELIKGNKAKVHAIHKDGTDGMTEMVLEDGAWKLEVPPGGAHEVAAHDGEVLGRVRQRAVPLLTVLNRLPPGAAAVLAPSPRAGYGSRASVGGPGGPAPPLTYDYVEAQEVSPPGPLTPSAPMPLGSVQYPARA